MIGGLSSASYENVVTTFKLKSEDYASSIQHSLSVDVSTDIDIKADFCSGGGFGIAGFGFEVCKEPFNSETEVGIFSGGLESNFGTQQTSSSDSNSFSTTWSFETSGDPWTAGYTSDVFVVPNLYVAVEKVISVQWNETSCDMLPFNEKLVFDLNVPPSEQALAFFSRYHVEQVTLPEMESSIAIQEKVVNDMDSGKKICCANPNEVPCEPKNRIAVCTNEEIALEKRRLGALRKGKDSWIKVLKDSIEPDTDSLSKWMSGSGFGMDDMHKDNELKLEEEDSLLTPIVSSGLAPEQLTDKAVVIKGAVDESNISENELNEGIKTAKRLQIAGM